MKTSSQWMILYHSSSNAPTFLFWARPRAGAQGACREHSPCLPGTRTCWGTPVYEWTTMTPCGRFSGGSMNVARRELGRERPSRRPPQKSHRDGTCPRGETSEVGGARASQAEATACPDGGPLGWNGGRPGGEERVSPGRWGALHGFPRGIGMTTSAFQKCPPGGCAEEGLRRGSRRWLQIAG